MVFNDAGQVAPVPVHAKVIPFGTDIVVRTDETIDSKSTQTGQLYRATITESVLDAAGGAGTPAQMLIRQVMTGRSGPQSGAGAGPVLGDGGWKAI